MTDLDPKLQSLFAEDNISDDGFSASVMLEIDQQQKSRSLSKWLFICVGALAVITATIYLGAAEFVALTLTSPILGLGEGWLAFALSPINNCGAILVVMLNLIRRILGGKSEWRGTLLPL